MGPSGPLHVTVTYYTFVELITDKKQHKNEEMHECVPQSGAALARFAIGKLKPLVS